MKRAEWNAALEMVAGINERVDLGNPTVAFATSEDVEDMIWDIEKLIEDYRETVISLKELSA
tara:strand:- start:5865 stop:6050 length:186 start_codon:yes stop_codon:yes gene_type:complete